MPRTSKTLLSALGCLAALLAPALLTGQTIVQTARPAAPSAIAGVPIRAMGLVSQPFAGVLGAGLPALSLTPSIALPAPGVLGEGVPLPNARESGLPAPGVLGEGVPLRAAAPEAAPEPPAATTAEKVGRMAEEVDAELSAAAAAGSRSSEDDAGTARSVFRSLTAEAAGAWSGVPLEGQGFQPEAAGGLFGLGEDGANLTQRKMVGTLYKVASIFSEHYAPVEWKRQQFQLDLKREFEKAVAVILAEPNIGTRRFQSLLVDFTAAMKDYHVGITFHSTEKAKLPLLIMGAEGRYFIAYIDREKLPLESFPLKEGDEVVEFDGVPTAKAVSALARGRTGNTAETDLRLAEITLTHRSRRMGEEVPQGKVVMKVRDRAGKVFEVTMDWDYTPEQVPIDVPVRDGGLDFHAVSGRTAESWDSAGSGPGGRSRLRDLLARVMSWTSHPLTSLFAQWRAAAPANPFAMGSPRGFLPTLGPVAWKAKGDNPFDAYIYTDRQGRKFAHVRIPDYNGGEEEAHAFGLLMNRFQKDPEVQGLVIDQTNNPGGNLFYVYALASRLTDKPLSAPKHRIIVDESDAAWALETLDKFSDPAKLEDEIEEMAESDEWSGYPVTPSFVDLIAKFARFILSELGAGRRLTGPTHMWGVDDIQPAPAKERFTKPILILVNELDFSGGDFFPAIMQDNGRAAIMGVRTSGAGGAVKPFEIANQFGIASLAATWTIALRKDGRPIENLGVTPDIPYALTAKDFQTGFGPYRLAVNEAMAKLAGRGSAAP
ncbi:MAG: protease-like activity factor CPAF [Elusimicrobiota bacterium]|jgi:hypothetical protein